MVVAVVKTCSETVPKTCSETVPNCFAVCLLVAVMSDIHQWRVLKYGW